MTHEECVKIIEDGFRKWHEEALGEALAGSGLGPEIDNLILRTTATSYAVGVRDGLAQGGFLVDPPTQ